MKPYLIPEQYLEIERKAEFKSEYCQGEMFAMPRVRLAHVQIVANAMRELGNQLAERALPATLQRHAGLRQACGLLYVSRRLGGLRQAPGGP